MQQNVSQNERFVSIAVGSWVLSRSLFARNKGKFGRLSQGATGAILLWRGLSGHCPVYERLGEEPLEGLKGGRKLEKSIMIHKTIEEVREVLGESDPAWYASSSKIFPITAGDLLWDLRLEEIDSGRQTLVRATLSEQNDVYGLKSRMNGKLLKQAADSELRKLKALVETGEIPTIKGPSNGQRSRVESADKKAKEEIEHSMRRELPQTIPTAAAEVTV